MAKIDIYTDGACSGNPGKGGYGVVVYKDGESIDKFSKGFINTTNNRMELMACIAGIRKYKGEGDITVITDSEYVKKGITEWIDNWKNNNWIASNRKPVKNKDLWIELDSIKKDVEWEWTRGHIGNEGNEEADSLAVSAMYGELEEDKGYEE